MTVSVMDMVSRSFFLPLLLYLTLSFLDGIKCANVSNVTAGGNESVANGRHLILPHKSSEVKLPKVRLLDLVQDSYGDSGPSRNETDPKKGKELDIVTEKRSSANDRPESVTVGAINRTEAEAATSMSTKSMESSVTESGHVTEQFSSSFRGTESTTPTNTGMLMNQTEPIPPRSTTMYMLWLATTESESPANRKESERTTTTRTEIIMNGSTTESQSQSVGSTTELSVIETDQVVSEEPTDEELAIDLEENVTVTSNQTGNEIVTVIDVTFNETSKVNQTIPERENKIKKTNQQIGLAEDYDSTSTSIYESTTFPYDSTTNEATENYESTTVPYESTTFLYDSTAFLYESTTFLYESTTFLYETTTVPYETTEMETSVPEEPQPEEELAAFSTPSSSTVPSTTGTVSTAVPYPYSSTRGYWRVSKIIPPVTRPGTWPGGRPVRPNGGKPVRPHGSRPIPNGNRPGSRPFP